MCSNENKSKIQQFYSGKTLLLTGGTGLLGKVLVAKLLHTCPDIRRMYLLVREKKGTTPEERMEKILNEEVFSPTKKVNSKFGEKLAIVSGDASKPGLDLSDRDKLLLIEEVDVVLHVAATIKFDEKLNVATSINLAGTREMCLLAQKINNLKAFVYVSTAYTNSEKGWIPETVCSPPIGPEDLLALTEMLDETTLETIKRPLLDLKRKPNTYIYTKSVAEEVINSFKSTIPVAILRPSLIIAAVSDPFPGWIDKVQGTTGIVVAIMVGLLRTYRCEKSFQLNNVPVDYVANAIIALAHSVATRSWPNEDSSLPVINFVAPSNNCQTIEEFGDMAHESAMQYPTNRAMWYPTIYLPKGQWVSALQRLLLHRLPAVIVDSVSALCGKPASLGKMYDRMDKFIGAIDHFTMRQFRFETHNATLLWETLEPRDKQLFPFNMADLDWRSFIPDYVRGCRLYLLKEDPLTIPKALTRMRILYCIHLFTKTILTALGVWLAWVVFNLIN